MLVCERREVVAARAAALDVVLREARALFGGELPPQVRQRLEAIVAELEIVESDMPKDASGE